MLKKEQQTELNQVASGLAFDGRSLKASTTIFAWQFRQLLFPFIKRLLDVLAALVMLAMILPPIMVFRVFQGSGRKLFRYETKIGRWGVPFDEFVLAPENSELLKITTKMGISRLAAAINLLRGDISLIGPRALTEAEARLIPVDLLHRLDIKPGLICLWWIRERANVGYEGEYATDLEYVAKRNLKTDAAILMKALPAAVFGAGTSAFAENLELLYIPLLNISMTGAIEKIIELLNGSETRQICFINADCANIAWKDPDYMKILRSGTINLADGIGLKIAGRLTGNHIRQNVNGTDLFPRLAQALSGTGLSVFFLGARPEVNLAMLQKTADSFPGLKIAGGQHGYFKQDEEQTVINMINDLRPDLLLVAFGAPHQEKWIARNLGRLNVKVAMGVGGLFDFYSGRIARAPVWMREIGMEWFFRFLQEPQRMWKRYFIGNALFLYRIIRANAGAKAPSLASLNKE